MSMIAAIVNTAISSLFEIDEMETVDLGDDRIQVTFVTTGVMPDTAKIKTVLWAIFGLPVQKVEDVKIYELQGNILKRYKVVVTLKPALKAIKNGEGLGVIDTLLGRNVQVYTSRQGLLGP